MAYRKISSISSSFQWRRDVFLSFRGEDTRFNFTDHLYSTLVHKGIRTFRDDEGLERGGEVHPSLSKAIGDSRISIVIFSKYYAHSKWCLDELDKIMQSKKQKGQIVVPVFYHVDPCDVRKQTGSFGEAFARYGEVSEERVLRWRAALTQAGSLAGWHVQHGYESEIIQTIAQNIFNMLMLHLKHLHVDEDLVGMDSRLEDMTSLLCMESNDVRMIGIHGIGGIGKTTLAKVVYNQIAHQFEDASFISSVAKPKDNHTLLQLQKQLLADVLGEKFVRISNIDEGITVIKKTLCSRKVLVVLDDVNDLTQLNSFVGNHQWFGPGSRIIITTRDKHLLDVHGVDQLYEVKGLKFEEAFQLFSQNAFKTNLPAEEFTKLLRRAVKYCHGLPLAIEVLGSVLYGKMICEWESELHRLEREPNMRIQNVLRRSFDALDHTQKMLFLDVACFFKGMDIHFVTRLLDDCNLYATSGIRVLNEKSLISIFDDKLLMHDLIQQMGHEIVRTESRTKVGKRSRLWDFEDIHHVLSTNSGTEAIEGISLDMSASREIQFTTKALKKMKRLRLLKVYQNIENDFVVSDKVHLPGEFEFPTAELRYLEWEGYNLESLPSNFVGEKLVELRLKYSSLEQLHRRIEPMRLAKLKVMDLSHSQHLVRCPDLSGAPSLETLILDGCTSLHEVHPSIGKLKNLIFLNLEDCKMLHYFPGITGLESLQFLNLSGCSRLEKFPEIQGNMGCLLELNLEATAIVDLPFSAGCLPRLVSLNMRNCKNLKILPNSICALKSLETLLLSGCSKLDKFPEIMEVMEHLKILLLDTASIRELPSSIVNLKGLLLLNLRNCENLRCLPNSICNLKSLEILNVSGCSKLNKLPEELGRFQCLSNLLADGTAITQPPTSLAHLRNLKRLSFSGCKGSTPKFWGAPFPFRLWHRENSDCAGLQLPSLLGLCSIKDLHLSDCNIMEGALDNKLCHLHSLEVLNLSRNNFVSIPADISGLSNLRVLLVMQCQRLQKIPKLPSSIKLLDARDCTSLKSLSTASPISRMQTSLQSSLSFTWLRPVTFILWNCSGLAQDYVALTLEKFHQNLFPEIGYSIVTPGSRIPKWFKHANMGPSVTMDLPPHWFDNNLLGVAICAVFSGKGPGGICCKFECREGPYFCSFNSWTKSGDRVVEIDHMWLIYLPRIHFLKSKSSSANVFRHIKASFSRFGAFNVVKRCGISVMYARDSVTRSRL